MSLSQPIAVTLTGDGWNRDITREVRNVRYRLQASGGMAGMSVDLDRPVGAFAPEACPYALLRASETRNASVLCEGRLEDPGVSMGSRENGRRLSALGASTHAQDTPGGYVAVDSSLDDLMPSVVSRKWINSSTEMITDQSGAFAFEGLRMSVTTGTEIPPISNVASFVYPTLMETGQKLASVVGSFLHGNVGSSLHRFGLRVGPNLDAFTGSTTDIAFLTGASPSPLSFLWRRGVEWSGGLDAIVPWFLWRWVSAGATFVAGEATWLGLGGNFRIRPVMHTATGAEISADSPFTTTHCASHEIVNDLLGTRLPKYNGAAAEVALGTDGLITQFAFRDPVTVDAMLADLIALEGDQFFWAAWETDANGLARFEWTRWPSTIRYELDAYDGLDLAGSTAGLYNRCIVRWRDSLGRLRTTLATATVDALTNAGLSRTGILDLGENLVTDLASAIIAGNAWLAQANVPVGGGTITVARPVLDRATGRMVMPHEMRPGCLAAVRGLDVSAASLSATARDGRSVFRVIAVEYDTARAAATLDLDRLPATTNHQLRGLTGEFANRRRN